MVEAVRNFSQSTERNLAESLRNMCQSQQTVDVIVGSGAQVLLVQALCTMIAGEDTGIAQKAAKAFKSLIKLTEALWTDGEAGTAYTL